MRHFKERISFLFYSSSIRQNMVEAFDMENMFRQAAIE